MRKSLLVVLLVLLAIGATLSAQPARLQYKDVAGTARTYKASYAIKGSFTIPGHGEMPMNMVMTFTIREKVLQMAADGTAQVSDELKDGSIVMKMNGEEQKQAFPALTMTFERTPQGKVSNMQMSGEGAETMKAMQGMGGMNQNFMSQLGSQIEFPSKELNFGDTWKLDVPPTEIMPGMKMDIAGLFTLTGKKVVDGKNLLQIDTTMNMNMPKTAMKGPDGTALPGMTMTMTMSNAKATSLFDEAAGALYSGSFNGTMKINVSMKDPESGDTTSMGGSLTITGWLKQVKVEKDAAFTAPAN